MPTTVNCPSCQRALVVPDALMGKRVKCPSCKMVFTVTPPDPPPAEEHDAGGYPLDSELEASARPRSPAPPPDEDADEEQPRVSRRPARRRGEYDEEEVGSYEDRTDEEEYEEEDDAYYRRRSRRRRAREAVAAPAIALIAVGGVYVCINFLVLIMRIINFSSAMKAAPLAGDPASVIGWKVGVYGGFGIELVGMFLGGTIILGAIQMKNLDNLTFAITASIVAMLPCHYCCLIGIPFGIWALIVLNQPDVKSAFR